MRILTAHDAEGNIHHVVVSPADAPPATVTTETGLLVAEVEAPEGISKLDTSDPERSRQQLAKVLQHLQDFRVDVGTKAKLVRTRSKGR
jgi:hypothetical protein